MSYELRVSGYELGVSSICPLCRFSPSAGSPVSRLDRVAHGS